MQHEWGGGLLGRGSDCSPLGPPGHSVTRARTWERGGGGAGFDPPHLGPYQPQLLAPQGGNPPSPQLGPKPRCGAAGGAGTELRCGSGVGGFCFLKEKGKGRTLTVLKKKKIRN